MRQRRVLFVCLAAAASSLVLSSCGGGPDTAGLEVGKTAPKIEAAGWLNGKPPTEEELRGKVVVVDAWASW
ncbi:MAG: TlpA family protein disulfide reductase [Planctomycetaceae bacterium]